VDVYVEPFVRPRLLIVVGATPIADALAQLARSMDYDVVRVVHPGERRAVEPGAAALGINAVALDDLASLVRDGTANSTPDGAVVVSQEPYDEQALEVLLKAGVPYVGLVASHKRGATVRSLLEENGVPGAAALRSPAGLDIGARTAPELALSILAEIVQSRTSRPREPTPATAPAVATSAVDPVCGMSVIVASARHLGEVDGTVYYFCCADCRAEFLKDPQTYLAPP
jgi:xanthine dehydrogenase accessory factor